MNTNDIKNYMQQMKRRNVLQKNNKEKQMQEEIMCLKMENERLKHDCEMHRDASIDCWYIIKDLREENRKLKEENRRLSDLFDMWE